MAFLSAQVDVGLLLPTHSEYNIGRKQKQLQIEFNFNYKLR